MTKELDLPYFKFSPKRWLSGNIITCSQKAQALFTKVMSFYWIKNCNVHVNTLEEHFKKQSEQLDELIRRDIIKLDRDGTAHINFLDQQYLEIIKDNNIIYNNIYVREKLVRTKIHRKENNYSPIFLARKLSNIIRSKKNIRHTPKQIKSWANDIRLLSERQGVPYERIQRALAWYKDNIGGQYIPVIESGSSLRTKFLRLEAAIERSSNYYNQPKTGYRDPKKKYEKQEYEE